MRPIDALQRIDLERVAGDLWRLVSIPSPTGCERQAAFAFADLLTQAGAEVEVQDTYPESPNVIGRLKGNRKGAVFQLAGHIDHINVPHPAPTWDGGVISGRGAADMKAGLAGILEAIRVLQEGGCDFPGDVLVTVYGLHEAPVGGGEGIRALIERGIVGTAGLVAESTHPSAGVAVIGGNGMAIWSLRVRWDGATSHELARPPEADSLLAVSLDIAKSLREHNGRLADQTAANPMVPPESVFIGQMHYGDFYNRVPTTCTLQGTRRWQPARDFEEVKQDFDSVLATTTRPEHIALATEWQLCGESFAVSVDEPVVQAFCSAHETVTGHTMPMGGTAIITDVNSLVSAAGVPTVQCGFDNEYAHADQEFVRIDRLLEPCRITLLTVLNFLNDVEREKELR